MIEDKKGVLGKRNSKEVTECMVCRSKDLRPVLFLGFLPPVNLMQKAGQALSEQPAYPAELLYCPECSLVQLGLVVSASILFPAEYPYTSSTTRILRENFAELSQEVRSLLSISTRDLAIDIGSNDGNLLSNFKDHMRVLGITPEDIGKIAVQRGIPTLFEYFDKNVIHKVLEGHGKAKIITATNVFAHIDDVHEVVEGITALLMDDGVFISESHYLYDLVDTLQYDAVYHEHLRYYSLRSLQYLLAMHGLEVFHAKGIPTHGGSIRVYAARNGSYPVRDSVQQLLEKEQVLGLDEDKLLEFKKRVLASKLELLAMLRELKNASKTIYGISAPSRASTLVNYVGIDDAMVDYVLEIEGSYKIGNYVPGTRIPIVNEKLLLERQPDYAILFSWHIADELMPKVRDKGFRGKFIVPLPQLRVV
jgi:C-methyltransferase-like protein/methyltransferase family protein/putative zinc binding protein